MQTGPNNPSADDLGVNFRALNDLFAISQNRKEFMSYEVGVQMMEIYNEQVRDLLCSDGSNKRYPMHGSTFVSCPCLCEKCSRSVFFWKDLTASNIGNQE